MIKLFQNFSEIDISFMSLDVKSDNGSDKLTVTVAFFFNFFWRDLVLILNYFCYFHIKRVSHLTKALNYFIEVTLFVKIRIYTYVIIGAYLPR